MTAYTPKEKLQPISNEDTSPGVSPLVEAIQVALERLEVLDIEGAILRLRAALRMTGVKP